LAGIVVPDATGRRLVDQQVAFPDRPIHIEPNDDIFPPLHTTSGGKCYLAFQSPGWVERYIAAGLPAWTKATITSPQELLREFALTRERGYALNMEETSAGVGAMAVPLRDAAGQVVGAATLASVVTEFTRATIREWLPLLREAAERLSEILAPDWRGRLPEPPGGGIPRPEGQTIT
jgi:DNA-binding IclR family transcriptional regulator